MAIRRWIPYSGVRTEPKNGRSQKPFLLHDHLLPTTAGANNAFVGEVIVPPIPPSSMVPIGGDKFF